MLNETLLRRALRIAAVYNIAWGAAVVLFPNLLFACSACRPSITPL